MDLSARGIGAAITGAANAPAFSGPLSFLQTQSLPDGVRDLAAGLSGQPAGASAPAAPAAPAVQTPAQAAALGSSILSKAPVFADGYHGLPAVLQAGVDKGQSPAEAAAQYHTLTHPDVQAAAAKVAPAANDFGAVADRFAAQNGGQINFAQLASLSDAYSKTTKAVPKAQTDADKAIGQAGDAATNLFQAAVAAAKADPDPKSGAAKLLEANKDYVANKIAIGSHGSQVNTAVGDALNGAGG